MGRGVNLDCLNPAGDPEPSTLLAHGFTAVRLVSKLDPNGAGVHPHIEERLAQYKAAGIRALVVITNESMGRIPANHHGICQFGNEPDGQPPSSWVMSKDDYVAGFNLYSNTYRDIAWIAAGLCSGNPQWWFDIMPRLEFCQGVAVHLYHEPLDYAEALLVEYQTANGAMPLYVTEWNPLGAWPLPAYDWALRQRTVDSFYFCWSDGMVPGFGLVDANGAPKPQLAAFNPISQPAPSPHPSPPPAPKPSAAPKPAIVQKILPDSCWGYSDDARGGHQVRFIVNHVAEGFGSLYNWFLQSGLSTHFWVSQTGVIEQYVPLSAAAYAEGNVTAGSDFPAGYPGNGPDYNRMGVSVEREGKAFGDADADEPSAAQWASIVALNRWLASTFGLPITNQHVIGHYRSDHVSRSRCPSSKSMDAPTYMARLLAAVAD